MAGNRGGAHEAGQFLVGSTPDDAIVRLVRGEPFTEVDDHGDAPAVDATGVHEGPRMLRTFDGSPGWPALRERLRGAGVADDTLTALDDAVAFAVERHGDQRRPAGEPYVEHLLEALEALVTATGGGDADTLRAALLHDVVEDTGTSLDEVRERFGPRVAELVDWVTKTDGTPRAAYLDRLRQAPAAAIDVKLADRLSNVQRLRTHPRPEKRASYYRETVETIVPLAADRPWFAEWYRQWQHDLADLAA